MTAGLLVVWSGTKPLSQLFPIPDAGLVLGRNLLGDTGDDRISAQHIRIRREKSHFVIEDLGSRNGTYVNGNKTQGITATQFVVIRTGRTIAIPVDDIAPYSGAATTRNGLVSGRRTAAVHDALDAVARDQSHVVILGDGGSGRGTLARMIAAKLREPQFEEDPAYTQDAAIELLDSLASSRDLRLVITRNRISVPFRKILADFLANNARTIEVPPLRERPDELAQIVHQTIQRNPTLVCHVSLLEYLLCRPENLGLMHQGLLDVARYWPEGATIKNTDYVSALQRNWVQIPKLRR